MYQYRYCTPWCTFQEIFWQFAAHFLHYVQLVTGIIYKKLQCWCPPWQGVQQTIVSLSHQSDKTYYLLCLRNCDTNNTTTLFTFLRLEFSNAISAGVFLLLGLTDLEARSLSSESTSAAASLSCFLFFSFLLFFFLRTKHPTHWYDR